MKRLRKILATVCTMVLLWVLASFVDVNANNMASRKYAPWNAFIMAAGQVKAVKNVKPPPAKDRPAVPGKLYTEKNIMLLASLIEAENGSALHDETLVLTGVCALKRVKSKSFPDTLKGVIYQKGAYSTAMGLDKVTPSERSIEIAEELLVYGVEEYPDSLVYQSMFPQGSKVYKKLDGEYFCLQ